MHIFLLSREVGNGECLEETHLFAYNNFLSALRAFQKLITEEEKNGEDAPNFWTRVGDNIYSDKEESEDAQWIWLNEIQYHTGMWGHIRYAIREVEIELENQNDAKNDYEDWLLFLKKHEADLPSLTPKE